MSESSFYRPSTQVRQVACSFHISFSSEKRTVVEELVEELEVLVERTRRRINWKLAILVLYKLKELK